jgi:regulator of protease activity HflC (stomatin/prohibitin superfamily)
LVAATLLSNSDCSCTVSQLTTFFHFVWIRLGLPPLSHLCRYGYQILQALITDLDPDQRVKNAMNEINSSKRLKYAVAERAEGDKILQVKSAEAEAEAKYLSGVGVAKQRKAIVDGLRTSILDFSADVSGASTKEVMDLLLLTQYFDMIRDVGQATHCKTTFVPSSKTLGDDVRNSLLQADSAK